MKESGILIDDDSGDGIPSIKSRGEYGELDGVKDAIGYSVAIPGDDAESRKFNRNLKEWSLPHYLDSRAGGWLRRVGLLILHGLAKEWTCPL